MASLTGTKVSDTYQQLLKLTSQGVDAGASAKYIEDGLGTDTALSLSTTRVGIGTTSPNAKLDISGDTSTWAGMAKIYFTDVNSNGSSRNWSIGNGGTAYGALSFIVSNAEDGVPADSTGTAVMSMDGVNKLVGIGTASPAKPLHISSAENQVARFESTDAYAGIELKDNGSSTLPPLISALSDDILFYGGHGSSRPLIMTIDGSTSRVGIGTASPAVTTHIHSDAETFAYVTTDSASHDTGIWFGHDIDGTAAYTGIVYDRDVYTLKLFNANSIANHLCINNEGQVGIGTASQNDYSTSADNLVVYDANHAGITIASPTDKSGNLFFADGTSGDSMYEGFIQYDHGNNVTDAMMFGTAGSERMRIASDGKVGIGTTPAGELHLHSGDNGVSYGLILENNRDANNNHFIEFRNSRLAVGDDESEGGDWLGEIMWKGYANGGHHVGSRIYSYAEADWSSTQHQSALVFQTTNGTTTSEQMRIRSDGKVWFQAGSNFKTSTIGSVDRLGMIDMYDDAGYDPVLHVMSDRDSNAFTALRLTAGTDSCSSAGDAVWIDFFDGDGTARGGIQNGSTVNNPQFYNGTSDERVKKDIVDTSTNGLNIINGLELKDFTMQKWFQPDGQNVTCDFVAQNAEKHFPAMVSEHRVEPRNDECKQEFIKAGIKSEEIKTADGTKEKFIIKTVSDGSLIPILVKALQEADNKINALSAKVEELEPTEQDDGPVNSVKERVNSLEARVNDLENG